MKSAQEILAEIDRAIDAWDDNYTNAANYADAVACSTTKKALRNLKQFILSGECKHEFAGTELNYCKKCGVGI